MSKFIKRDGVWWLKNDANLSPGDVTTVTRNDGSTVRVKVGGSIGHGIHKFENIDKYDNDNDYDEEYYDAIMEPF